MLSFILVHFLVFAAFIIKKKCCENGDNGKRESGKLKLCFDFGVVFIGIATMKKVSPCFLAINGNLLRQLVQLLST